MIYSRYSVMGCNSVLEHIELAFNRGMKKKVLKKYVISGKDYFHGKIKFVKDGNPLVKVLVVGTFFSNLYKKVNRENSPII